MTGFSPKVRQLLEERCGFWRTCEVCGEARASEAHHRRPRGAGSTKRAETNQAANALMLCRDCHRMIESHRAVALACGWLVGQHANPAEVAVMYRGRLCWLGDDGSIRDSEEVA